MKDIKSVMIGLLLATCCFLLMGYTLKKDVGTYQGVSNNGKIWILDTRDGSYKLFR